MGYARTTALIAFVASTLLSSAAMAQSNWFAQNGELAIRQQSAINARAHK